MASPPVLEDPHLASRRAKTRIGVAVVLLGVAVGGLALLSRHKPEPAADAMETAAPLKQESVSSAENEPVESPEIQPAEIAATAVEAPPAPGATAEPALPPPPPPPPAIVNQPLPDAARRAPATPRSVSAAEPFVESPVEPQPQAATPWTPPVKQQSPVNPTANQPAEPKAGPPRVQPAAKAEPAPRAFLVQVGVFTDMDNARQLQTRLAENGIPSHTETRLQLGPFRSKAEADAAQLKLRTLGMGAVILPLK